MSLSRSFNVGAARREPSGDLIVPLAFASEAPVQRWFGTEILEVTARAVDLSRLNDGAALLYNHDWSDLRGVHVPGSVRVDADRIARADVRITAATQAGRDAIALVEGGVLTKASVGYEILRVREVAKKRDGSRSERVIDGAAFTRALAGASVRGEPRLGGDPRGFQRALDAAVGSFERAQDELPTYVVERWLPLENSLVTVPADAAVGVGRSASQTTHAAQAAAQPGESMSDTATTAAASNAGQPTHQTVAAEARSAPPAAASEHGAAPPGGSRTSDAAMQMERDRHRAIGNLCRANRIDDGIRDMWISSGASVAQVSDELVRLLEERGRSNPTSAAAIGMSSAEARRFSILRAIQAVVDNNWSRAGFESEASRAVAERLNRTPDPRRFFVPFEVQRREMPVMGRDLTAAGVTTGRELVATEVMSFIEMLRNRSVAYSMGARRLAGLVGNVTIPRQTGGATFQWLGTESTQINESNQVFSQINLSPKNAGAYTEISRQLMLQSSPDAEALVQADLAKTAALGVDAAVLAADGQGGKPLGIMKTPGIGSVVGANLGYAGLLECQTDIAVANVVPESGGYVTTAQVAAKLMTRTKWDGTETPLWDGNVWDGRVSGFRGMSSNQMPADAMLFGDWAQAVIAEWGVLEIEVNPYANFQAGIVGVRAMVSVDVALRHAAAFSLAESIT